MKRDYNCDLLKVKYIGVYHSLRFSRDKEYIAERDPIFGMMRLTDELGEECSIEEDEFEIIKILESAGMPDDE